MTSNHSIPDRIHLTEAKLASLRAHILRTGVSVRALLKLHEKEAQGITYKIVYDWLTGRVKSADARHYKTIIEIYKSLPDENEHYAEVSEGTLLALHREKNRTRVSARQLFARADHVPEGLTVFHVENMVRGLVKKTRREYLEFVLRQWEMQPDAPIRVPITPDILARMLQEKERTGVGPMALLHNTNKERPQRLTTSLIGSWLEGKTKSARKDHLAFVLRRWKTMPSAIKER